MSIFDGVNSQTELCLILFELLRVHHLQCLVVVVLPLDDEHMVSAICDLPGLDKGSRCCIADVEQVNPVWLPGKQVGELLLRETMSLYQACAEPSSMGLLGLDLEHHFDFRGWLEERVPWMLLCIRVPIDPRVCKPENKEVLADLDS